MCAHISSRGGSGERRDSASVLRINSSRCSSSIDAPSSSENFISPAMLQVFHVTSHAPALLSSLMCLQELTAHRQLQRAYILPGRAYQCSAIDLRQLFDSFLNSGYKLDIARTLFDVNVMCSLDAHETRGCTSPSS